MRAASWKDSEDVCASWIGGRRVLAHSGISRGDTVHPTIYQETKADLKEIKVVAGVVKQVKDAAALGSRLPIARMYRPQDPQGRELIAFSAKILPEFAAYILRGEGNRAVHYQDVCIRENARIFVLYGETLRRAAVEKKTPMVAFRKNICIGGIVVCREEDLEHILDCHERREEILVEVDKVLAGRKQTAIAAK